MTSVVRQAAAGLVLLLAALGAAVFWPADTVDYWQAWLFLAVFGVATAAITAYLAWRDPALLARRVRVGPAAEPRARQKAIQAAASLAFLAVFVVSGLDHRAGWSSVPVAAVIAGDALVALGLFVVFLVFRVNAFSSAVVELHREQQLVSTGPYAVVRHPMYSGGLLVLLGTPIALGAWWSLVPALGVAAAIVVRLLDEERLLVAGLPGYSAYRDRVPYRLVPRVW
jgi:protein-S-isoprenylcysteine O-methyltransferase Ste14